MSAETMNISLPDNLKRYVESRVAEGGYGDPGEYILELIRQDRETRQRQAQERLEGLLLEGLESGPAELVTPDEWEAIRREGRERLARLQEAQPKAE
jgi:antitoxin ParD1/3/4